MFQIHPQPIEMETIQLHNNSWDALSRPIFHAAPLGIQRVVPQVENAIVYSHVHVYNLDQRFPTYAGGLRLFEVRLRVRSVNS